MAPRELAQVALAKHAGVAVYARSTNEPPAFVFSLGAVTAIATDTWQPYDTTTPIGLVPGDQLFVGTPSVDVLPAELRHAIADYMRTNDHVQTPKIALVAVKNASGEFRPPWEMAPNLRRSDFPTESAWIEEGHRVEWFIPPRYVAIRPPLTDARFDAWFNAVQPLWP